MSEIWRSLTEGQGAVVASLVTLLAAVLGVILGWVLFSGKVRSLETALDASEQKMRDHIRVVDATLKNFSDEANQQLSAIMEQMNKLGGSVQDRLAQTTEPPNARGRASRDTLKLNWERIRDRLEDIASDPNEDGRRRAKWGRIDRRNYSDLVNSLAADAKLGEHSAAYAEAAGLWQRFRNGKATPAAKEVERMRELAISLTGAQVEMNASN